MGRGGARPGAGRKPGDKKTVQFWVTESEAEVLRKTLEDYRKTAKEEINVAKSLLTDGIDA